VNFNNSDPDSAKAEIDEICKKLLSNPVMENYEFEIEDIN
jgi:phosphoribosylformylglycinamidine synthase